ncbi:MAG: hypothetical protein VCG02_00875 [Verrucomicrobiota bacterium]
MTIKSYERALSEAEQRIIDLEKQIQYVNKLLSAEPHCDDDLE